MAINFPATGGQPTDGTFTYVAAGITYSWNGESWSAAGSGASATDLTVFSVTNASASGSGSLAYNSNTGDFTFTPPNLSGYLTSVGILNNHTDVNITNVANGQLLKYSTFSGDWENAGFSVSELSNVDVTLNGGPNNGDTLNWNSSNSTWENGAARSVSTDVGSYAYFGGSLQIEGVAQPELLYLSNGGYPVGISDNNFSTGTAGQVLTSTGSGGVEWQTTSLPTGLQTRTTAQVTTAPLLSTGSTDVSITTPKTYALLKIQTSHAAWVTLYTDTASRTADAGRSETTDPTPGSGVIAEVITAGNVTQLITPGTIGFNSAGTGTTYAKVVNKSGATANITVTLHYVQLEG